MDPTTHRILLKSAASLPEIDTESVHLVVTSPPYPMIGMWDGSFSDQDPAIGELLEHDDAEAWARMHGILDNVWTEMERILIHGGYLCINIGDATRSFRDRFRLFTNHSRVTSACEARGFHSLPPIIWRKPTNAPNKFMGSGMLPGGAYVTLEHEYLLVLRKGGRRVFPPSDRRRRRESAYFWEERNTWFSDQWDLTGVRQSSQPIDGRDRSGAFPGEIAQRLIQMYSLIGDTVLDPFAGTGTTATAAIAAARNSILVEIEPEMAPTIDQTVNTALAVDAAPGGRVYRVGESSPLVQRGRRRLEDHRRAMETLAREGKRKPAYVNEGLQVPVVTGQETDLVIPVPVTVSVDAVFGTAGNVGAPGAATPSAARIYRVSHEAISS